MAAKSKKLREAKMDERGEGEGRRARSRLVWGGDRLSDEQGATGLEIRPHTSPRSLRCKEIVAALRPPDALHSRSFSP